MWCNAPHWKIIPPICCARRSPKVTLIIVFVSIVALKQVRRPPLFITKLHRKSMTGSFTRESPWTHFFTSSSVYEIVEKILLGPHCFKPKSLETLLYYAQIFTPLFLDVSHRTPRKNKNDIYSLKISAIVPVKISVKYTNEMTNDIMHSTQYYTKYINKSILANLQGRPLKLDRLIVLQETQICSMATQTFPVPTNLMSRFQFEKC